MNTGSPPTAPKARAGLLTPPGIRRFARSKAARLLGRCIGGMCMGLPGLPGLLGPVGPRSPMTIELRGLPQQLVGLLDQPAEGVGLALVQVADVAEDVPPAQPPGRQVVRQEDLCRGQRVGDELRSPLG